MDPSLEPDSDVWRLFLYAMKSPVTRDKYQWRLSKFFEFAGVKGELAKAWIGQEAIATPKEKESRAKGKK